MTILILDVSDVLVSCVYNLSSKEFSDSYIKLTSELDGISASVLCNDCFGDMWGIFIFTISVLFCVWLGWFHSYCLGIFGNFGQSASFSFYVHLYLLFWFVLSYGVCQVFIIVMNICCTKVRGITSWTSSCASICNICKASLMKRLCPYNFRSKKVFS